MFLSFLLFSCDVNGLMPRRGRVCLEDLSVKENVDRDLVKNIVLVAKAQK